MTEKIYCAVPFFVGFLDDRMNFRNCCSADPQLQSNEESFSDWWASEKMNSFREEFGSGWPQSCARCKHQEENGIKSFRQSINDQVKSNVIKDSVQWPLHWNIPFSNICNLGCWTCADSASSYIENQKRKLGLLSDEYISPNQRFKKLWPGLKQDVLKSYQHHDTVTLTILGGEPLYNKDVIDFLLELVDLGLHTRTRLEFHTNATVMNKKIENIFKLNWQYICVFFSLDAVGSKAEWLRYNCLWSEVEKNVPLINAVVDYTEVHCTVSVLNIMDIVKLQEFCDAVAVPLKPSLLSSPDFLSIYSWPLLPDILVEPKDLGKYPGFYDLIGSKPDRSAPEKIKNHINQFNSLRKPIEDFDKKFAEILKNI